VTGEEALKICAFAGNGQGRFGDGSLWTLADLKL